MPLQRDLQENVPFLNVGNFEGPSSWEPDVAERGRASANRRYRLHLGVLGSLLVFSNLFWAIKLLTADSTCVRPQMIYSKSLVHRYDQVEVNLEC